MKNIVFILLSMLSVNLYAQSSVSMKVGGIFSNPSDKYFSGSPGINIGLSYSHNFNRVQFTIEPGFASKCLKSEASLTDVNGNPIGEVVTSKIKYRFFEAPITIGYLFLNDKFKLGAHVGAAPGILINEKYIISYPAVSFINPKNQFNIDAIAGVKAGVSISDKIYVGAVARYCLGLTQYTPKPNTSLNYFNAFFEVAYTF